MKYSQFKSNSQEDVRSTLFSSKKVTLISNSKQIIVCNLNKLKICCEYIIFHWNLFFVSIKKDYLFQLLTFQEIGNYFNQSYINLNLKKLKNSRNTFFLFCNIPFLFSTTISDIFKSVQKKTIYLYRLFLLLSIPVIIFFVNQTFISQNEKESLSLLLPENKKILSSIESHKLQKVFLDCKILRKKILQNQIAQFLYQRVKSLNSTKKEFLILFDKKISYLASLSKIYPEKPSWATLSFKTPSSEKIKKIFLSNYSPPSNNLMTFQTLEKGTKFADKKTEIFSKWLSFYFKIKRNYLIAPYGAFWDLVQKNNSKIEDQKIKRVNFVNYKASSNFPKKLLSNRHSFISDILNFQRSNEIDRQGDNKRLLLLQKTISSCQPITIKTKKNLFQKINNRQWMIIIKEWMNLYPSYDKLVSFSKNKQKVKENFYYFQKEKSFIKFFNKFFSFWTPLGQIYFENSLLKRANFLTSTNKQPFVFRSYKKALTFSTNYSELASYLNGETSLFFLRSKSDSLELFPFSFRSTLNKKLFKQINFLYNFSTHIKKNDLFTNPEVFSLVYNRLKMPRRSFEGFLSTNFLSKNSDNPYIYDFEFSLKQKNLAEDLFWIPNLSLQKKILEQKEKKQFSCSVETSTLLSFNQDLKIITKKRETRQKNVNGLKTTVLKRYNEWFFTPYWWFFQRDGFLPKIESLKEDLSNITKILYQNSLTKIDSEKKKYLKSTQNLAKISTSFPFIPTVWNKVLLQRIYISPQENPFWINTHLIGATSNDVWSFFSWFIASSIVYYHWVPMFTGVIYLFLWLDFERIRSYSYPSWKTFLSILTHSSLDSSSQQLRLVGYLSRGRLFFLYSQLYKIYNRFFYFFNRLNYITTSDLSPRNKNLVSNSLITKKTLESKYYFWNINRENTTDFIGTNSSINGFDFFQKWSEINCRLSSFYPVVKSPSLKWLSNLFLYNNNLTYVVNNPGTVTKTSGNWKSKPVSLSEPITYAQRLLFIGSLESGKSYIVKNIAAGVRYPLIHVSIKDIKNATPDNKYNKIKKHKRWVEQLSERSFLLENIINLAKIVSPSILWISDLHDFDKKNQIQDKKTQKFDISLLMATLLKILSIDLVPETQNNITFIGSTEYPRLLDPKFVSRQRLDLIVNFRTPSFNQRKNIFTSLLKTKGFTIKGLRSFYELNSNTLGYTFRDITHLVNETLLIKTTDTMRQIDSKTIRLALYRQTSTQSVKYKRIRQENLQYKIGKAVIQTILVYPKPLILLSKYNDLWRTKFYYLSNTYLEVSSKKAITTEFVLLTQILNCLAGSAARDAWILSTKSFMHNNQTPLSFTSQLKHDFAIASNILQSLLVEFSKQDIASFSLQKKKNREEILKTFHFNFLKRAMSYLEFLDQFPSYINWSIKGKRISFNWILFFNGIQHSTKNLAIKKILLLDKNKKNLFSSIFSKNGDIDVPYERKETKRQQQKIQKIDSFFNELVSSLYMENLGFPWESNYVMDYNPFQFPLFFREARPLWIPQTTPSYSLLFFDRHLVINQKLLTTLYITYGNKFQLEKLNRKRIKKQIFWSNSSFNKVDLNKISERKNDVGNDQTFPLGNRSSDFHFYQNLINLNAQLDQSQIQLPVYLHQGWITADPSETYRVFDIFSNKILVNNHNLINKESFLFEILLEIYHYLLKFFIKNKKIGGEMNEILLRREILYREDIESLIKKSF